MEFSSSPLFWQTTLLEMAARSLFQRGEISGFYTHLIVVQAEVSTAVSVICWDLGPCQWKINNCHHSSKESFRFLLGAQTMPSLSWGHQVMDFSLSVSSGCTGQHYWQSILFTPYKQKRKSISICCQMEILRRLMTNKESLIHPLSQ